MAQQVFWEEETEFLYIIFTSLTRKTQCTYFSFLMLNDIRKSITFIGTPPDLARLHPPPLFSCKDDDK
jgi:hypothetical protein